VSAVAKALEARQSFSSEDKSKPTLPPLLGGLQRWQPAGARGTRDTVWPLVATGGMSPELAPGRASDRGPGSGKPREGPSATAGRCV